MKLVKLMKLVKRALTGKTEVRIRPLPLPVVFVMNSAISV